MMRRGLLALAATVVIACGTDPNVVVVGSKNFSESVLLGELLAQAFESRGVSVQRKLNLGGTFVCHQALVAGELDAYVEYTGTGYAAILELPTERDQRVVEATLAREYRERWNLHWMQPLGFDNTYAMLVRGEMARRLGITRMSEAVPYAPKWRGGFGFEFEARADGLPGFLEWYGFQFDRQPVAMELGLMYRALADGQVDIVAGNATDGQIKAMDFVHLADDLGYFPVYQAVPVIRADLLERFPRLQEVFDLLGSSISEDAMRQMNYQVDGEGRDVRDVAAEFWAALDTVAVDGS